MTAVRYLRIVGAIAALAALTPVGESVADDRVSIEFLITGDAVISLRMNGGEISLDTPFRADSIVRAMPGYAIQYLEEMEGSEGFQLSRDGIPMLTILGSSATEKILYIWIDQAAIDAIGVRVGNRLQRGYRTSIANCATGLNLVCQSEHSRYIWYDVGGPEDCKFSAVDGPNKIPACATVAGFELGPDE